MNGTDTMIEEKFKVIVLATDGSEFSAGVERVGVEMASRHQAQLYVLRLIMAEEGTSDSEAEEQEAAVTLGRVRTQCTERDVHCSPLVHHCDDPSTGILAALKEVNADLVIIGRRGKRGLAKMMVGDATTKVLEKSECSVLVVPRLVSYWNSGVLLVVDPDQTEGDAVAHAAYRLAQASNLPLSVLLVVDEDEIEKPETNQSINRLVAMAKLKNIQVDGQVQTGNLDDVILEVARQRTADIIVCEPRDRSMMERLFNTNNLLKLIGQAHCPVMVVKPCDNPAPAA